MTADNEREDKLARARHHVETSHPERALEVLDALPPGAVGVEAYSLRARALGQLGRWWEAEMSLRSALKEAPDDAVIMGSLGWAAHAQGDFARAVPTLEHAVALAPVNHVLRVNLAMVLAASGQHDRAGHTLATAMEMAPESDAVQRGRMWLAYRRRDFAAACELAAAVLARRPDDIDALRVLGASEAGRGKMRSASRHLRRGAAQRLGDVALARSARTTAVYSRWWALPTAPFFMLPLRYRRRAAIACSIVGLTLLLVVGGSPWVYVVGAVFEGYVLYLAVVTRVIRVATKRRSR